MFSIKRSLRTSDWVASWTKCRLTVFQSCEQAAQSGFWFKEWILKLKVWCDHRQIRWAELDVEVDSWLYGKIWGYSQQLVRSNLRQRRKLSAERKRRLVLYKAQRRVKPTAAGKWTRIPDFHETNVPSCIIIIITLILTLPHGNTRISWADTSRFSKLVFLAFCLMRVVTFTLDLVPRDSTTTWSPWILRGRPKARTLPRWSHGATQSCSGGSNDAAGIGLQGSSQGGDSAGGSWSPPVTHRKQSCLLYLSDAQLLVVLIVRTHIISLCVHYKKYVLFQIWCQLCLCPSQEYSHVSMNNSKHPTWWW